jgi:hypothetical protein
MVSKGTPEVVRYKINFRQRVGRSVALVHHVERSRAHPSNRQ